MDSLNLPAEPGNRRAAVYERLRSDIAHGRIAPGQRLSEQGIAEALGVSRTPVREALSQLLSDGLLVALGRGYAAPDLTPANIDDIYEMRLLLEPPIARHAARHASHDQVVALRQAINDEAVFGSQGALCVDNPRWEYFQASIQCSNGTVIPRCKTFKYCVAAPVWKCYYDYAQDVFEDHSDALIWTRNASF